MVGVGWGKHGIRSEMGVTWYQEWDGGNMVGVGWGKHGVSLSEMGETLCQE